MSEYLKEVGCRLRKYRNLRGLSLKELAELSGQNYCSISMIETGKQNPMLLTLKKLADSLEVDLKDIV